MTTSDSTDTGAGKPVARRRQVPSGLSPMETLTQMPALVVLARFPTPVLLVDGSGSIVFVNAAYADMVGQPIGDLMSTPFGAIFHAQRVGAGPMVELDHADGSVVVARMSKAELLAGDDSVRLVTFQDVTEQIWAEEP